MDDDEKGKRFLELIDEQNNIQWSLIVKLSSLINLEWNSSKLQNDLEELVKKHSQITTEINSLDKSSSML